MPIVGLVVAANSGCLGLDMLQKPAIALRLINRLYITSFALLLSAHLDFTNALDFTMLEKQI